MLVFQSELDNLYEMYAKQNCRSMGLERLNRLKKATKLILKLMSKYIFPMHTLKFPHIDISNAFKKYTF